MSQVARAGLAFEDFVYLDDHSVQRILKEVDGNVLAVALRTASADLLARIYMNLSSRAVVLLKEDIALGPIHMDEVLAAQQQVIDLIGSLEQSGQIRIRRRSDP